MGKSGVSRARRRKNLKTPLWLPAILFVGFLAFIVGEKNPDAVAVVLIVGIAMFAYVVFEQNRRRYQRWVNRREVQLLTPQQFEQHVAEYYRQSGYKIRMTPRVGDQGVDVIAERRGERIGIQCKLYSANVSNDAVQQVLAGKHYYECSHAVVVPSSGFTASARELAKRSKVELVDGPSYAERMRKLIASRDRKGTYAEPVAVTKEG